MSQRKPKLGQNFLSDAGACRRIVDALGDISNTTVLEIGPGSGALTGLLASRARRVVAVELDAELARRLSAHAEEKSNLRVICADVLRLDLAALASRETISENSKLFVVGNLPYYITSDILLHLFAHADSIQRAVVMVQEEVADRLAAHPGIRDYGVLSATAQMHARIEKLFTLPPSAFSPPPKVNSAVVRMEMAPRFVELNVDRAGFLRFVQSCFRQKRKTLVNNLRSAGIASAADASAAIQEAGLAMDVRVEAVSLEQMALLFRFLQPEK